MSDPQLNSNIACSMSSDVHHVDVQEHGRQQELKQEQLVITTEQARADAQSQMNQQLQEAQQQMATLQQSLADSNTAHDQSLQVALTAAYTFVLSTCLRRAWR